MARTKRTAPSSHAVALARSLLANAAGKIDSERRVIAAFDSFQKLLGSGDERAVAAHAELQASTQSTFAAAYFLEVLQAEVDPAARKARGVFFTPGAVVDYMVNRIDQLAPPGPLRIVDPACGSGVFLLAAAKLAEQRPGSSLLGCDISLAAVEVSRSLLASSPVPHEILHVNPLLAGEELRAQLLEHKATLVVLGNPPYANYGRLNRGRWIDALLADYRRDISEQKLNLTDDFIKFLRWGQHWIDQAHGGLLAMITSRTYLTGVTHRGLRRSLTESFSQVEITDLHGDGTSGDENIFGIRRGVAIGLFGTGIPKAISYASLTGTRAMKLAALAQGDLSHTAVSPTAPQWWFTPQIGSARRESYLAWLRLDEIFIDFISGVQTKNDALLVDFDREVLAARMEQHLAAANFVAAGIAFDPSCLRPYVVGPLDRRWIYYEPRLVGRARWSVMRHMLGGDNLGLVFMRQSTGVRYDHALVVDTLVSDRAFYSRRGAPFLAPLHRGSEGVNLHVAWLEQCQDRLGQCRAEELFAWVYAVLHAPSYRDRFLTELQFDFPHIPWPPRDVRASQLIALGQQLMSLHLGKPVGCSSEAKNTTVPHNSSLMIQRGYPRLIDDTIQLSRHASLPLKDPAAWSWQLGGYAVLAQWLKARQGRALTPEDLCYVNWLGDIACMSQRLEQEMDALMTDYLA